MSYDHPSSTSQSLIRSKLIHIIFPNFGCNQAVGVAEVKAKAEHFVSIVLGVVEVS